MRLLSALLVLVPMFWHLQETRAYPMEEQTASSSSSRSFYNVASSESKKKTVSQVSNIIGDANGDGQVNVADVTVVVNKVLGINVPIFIPANSDVNFDGDINVSDVMLIVTMILTGDSELGPGDVEDPDVGGN